MPSKSKQLFEDERACGDVGRCEPIVLGVAARHSRQSSQTIASAFPPMGLHTFRLIS